MRYFDLSHVSIVRRIMRQLWEAPDHRTSHARPAREIAMGAHMQSRRARLRG